MNYSFKILNGATVVLLLFLEKNDTMTTKRQDEIQ